MTETATLKRRALGATAWTVAAYGGREVLRLLGSLVLTRLLWPGAYGLMTLTNITITGLMLFSDIGLGPSIIQNKRGEDPRFLNTAWTLQCMRGVVLTTCAWAIAYPIARWYDSTLLFPMICLTSVIAFFSGFDSTSLITETRRLTLKKLTIIELLSQAISIIAMIVFALMIKSRFDATCNATYEQLDPENGFRAFVIALTHESLMVLTVWTLVVGALLGRLAKMVLSHTMLPSRNQFHWDRKIAGELLRFGRWIFLSTLLTFLAQRGDMLLIGKFTNEDTLGRYAVAMILAYIPISIVSAISSRVILPAFSQAWNSGRDFGRAYLRVRAPVLVAGGVLVSGLFAVGPNAIRILYDERYWSAGVLLPLLAIGTWFQVLEIGNGQALIAMGKVSRMAAGHVAKIIGMAIGMPLGYHLGGAEHALYGMVAGIVFGDVLKYIVSTIATVADNLRGYRLDAIVMLYGGFVLLGHHFYQPAMESWARSLLPNASLRWQHFGEFVACGILIVVSWIPLGGVAIRRYRRGRQNAG